MELSAISLIILRKLVTKRKLLEWQTYQELVTTLKGTLQETLRVMALPFAVSLFFALYVALSHNLLLYPFALVWVLSPFLAFAMSKPPAPYIPKNLTAEETGFLRTEAARIWAYYETFVTKESNFLPPDNVQRGTFVAYATSPTNIGAYFLSLVSAWKLGYTTPSELLERTSDSLASILRMKKERGHLYNWYNIKTLEPHRPGYISSVDSGNFIASLFVLQGALGELRDQKDVPISQHVREALSDYVRIVQEAAAPHKESRIRELASQIGGAIREKDLSSIGSVDLALKEMETFIANDPHPERYEELLFWSHHIRTRIDKLTESAAWNIDQEKIEELRSAVKSLIVNTNFRFLYNGERNLFQIGHNLALKKKDEASYDLFGSEANITSFVSIALNQIGQTHWKKLGRTLINSKKGPVLLSWGGSLFEHINNLIFFRAIPASLLWENGKKVVGMHMHYARNLGIPWGMSESAHFASKTSDSVHYRIFGVPDIGVKRDLTQYRVVSPYASFISLPFCPKEAVRNLLALQKVGACGRFGFYDAVDFAELKTPRPVPVHYAHHMGFSFAAICNYLTDNAIQKLFSDNPYVIAGEYLLEELYIVDTKPSRLPRKEHYAESTRFETAGMPIKEFIPAYTPTPQSIVLSNGTLSCIMTNNGTSRLAMRDTMLTSCARVDPMGPQGWNIMIRDKETNTEWSPSPIRPRHAEKDDIRYRIGFYDNIAQFHTWHEGVDTHMEATVSPHEHMEIRKLTLENTTNEVKNLEVETGGSACLAREKKELSAPYFHRLFLRCSVIQEYAAWIVERAYHFGDEEHIKLVHWISSPHRKIPLRISSRAQRLGFKQHSWFDPNARFSSIADVQLHPKERITLYCVTGAVQEDQNVRAVIKKYSHSKYCEEIFERAFQYENQYLRELNTNYTKARMYRILGSKIFWQDPSVPHAPLLSLPCQEIFCGDSGSQEISPLS
jgi:cyclic beta-1,2-glucan synthetase